MLEAAPTTTPDFDGAVKRYVRSIKVGHEERVWKMVLFDAALSYFGRIYIQNTQLRRSVEIEMARRRANDEQVLFQSETTDSEFAQMRAGVVNLNGLSAEHCEPRADFGR